MDIVVTLPKKYGYDHLLEKIYAANEGLVVWWNMSRIPKELKEGEKLFVVFDGKIEGYFEVFEIQETAIDLTTYQEIKSIKMKGFRGFRYRKFVFEEVA